MAYIFSVRELTQAVKATLEGEFPLIWVRGQVSNLSRPGSGHIYFTLKDGDACLGAVWFKSQQWQIGSGGCPRIADGQEVVCVGRLTVYPPRGTYQLVVEMVQDQGLGALFMAFEALKKRLAAQGYFDTDRKRPLPSYPRRVAVVTAPNSAALRDFLCLSDERGFGASIRIHPVLVQGEEAPGQIVRAVQEANLHEWAEVIVLIRGGGSLEDLWAFNSEDLAKSIFVSNIPVLTGIGHEVDTSIADLVADVRAATPSHAAQLLWPERRELIQAVDELECRLQKAGRELLRRKEVLLTGQEKALAWLSPRVRVLRAMERLETLERDMCRSAQRMMENRRLTLEQSRAALTRTLGVRYWSARQAHLEQQIRMLCSAASEPVRTREHGLGKLEISLNSLDPVRPLRKGFCLVESVQTGRYVRDSREVAQGDTLRIMPRSGTITAEVIARDEE
ncbi:Exodeoxyribonuclease VII large subunit [Desulfonatronum thiosulfatophilum]|uniref:Exodeoxyribonuclease 7 large subunit n=1 Tax=Desulfonatronum thiosulfatophilum TaxID=617002 RepID=A0A1G6EK85_9BACT|nr:exodeoxyribonuclease VII large subunit [Desulfonatronum thiosulfatophilum]SDB57861.1 Exodeoxyribonuclease VII large subunit [Desulfonatronum thiosulfatophilum]